MSEWTLMDHLTDQLLRPRLGDNKEPNFYPSEATAVYKDQYDETVIAGKCRRASWFRLVTDWVDFDPVNWNHMKPWAAELERKAIPIDKYTAWIFEAGNMYEEHLIDMAKKTGVFIAEQVPVFLPDPRIGGRMDILVINPHTGKLSIVEAKSIYGHNVAGVLGKPATSRSSMVPGVPRDSHLMQLAIYQWKYAMPRSEFEEGRLVYGARDKGDYGEYLVRITNNEPSKVFSIQYKQVLPIELDWVTSPITINSIIDDGYRYVQNHLDRGEVPPRDFDLQYTDAKLDKLYQRNELSKADAEKWEKLKVIQIREKVSSGEALLQQEQALHDKYDGKRIKADQKSLEKGDWQCRFCKWKDVCYDRSGQPNKL